MDHAVLGCGEPDVVIVGAGIAGLTAAYVAAKAGLTVLVLERATYPGGRMSSEEVDGCVLDRGAYTLSGYAGRTLALAEEIGCRDRITPLTPWAGYAHPRSIRRYRSDLMPSMALGVGLHPGDMLAGLRLLRASTRLAAHLRLHRPDEETFALERESAAELALRTGGPRLLERVAYPLISALYISDPEHTSAAALLATIGYIRGLTLYNSAEGIGLLCRELAARVPVRFECDVEAITADDDGLEIWFRGDKGGRVRARAVVCATAAPDALRLLPGADEALAASLADVAYTPCIVTTLILQGRLEERAFSIALPRDRFPLLAALTCEHNKHPARVPADRDALTAYSTAAGAASLLDLDDDGVVAAVLAQAERAYPGVSARVAGARVYRWPLACSQLRPGDLRRRAQLRASLPARGPLFFAGDYLVSSSSIEGCVVSGLSAGAKAAQFVATG